MCFYNYAVEYWCLAYIQVYPMDFHVGSPLLAYGSYPFDVFPSNPLKTLMTMAPLTLPLYLHHEGNFHTKMLDCVPIIDVQVCCCCRYTPMILPSRL